MRRHHAGFPARFPTRYGREGQEVCDDRAVSPRWLVCPFAQTPFPLLSPVLFAITSSIHKPCPTIDWSSTGNNLIIDSFLIFLCELWNQGTNKYATILHRVTHISQTGNKHLAANN